MLMTEWNLDDALAVRFEEGTERGIEIGIERGAEKERQKNYKEKLDNARNGKAEGIPIDTIHRLTGLDIETIKNI